MWQVIDTDVETSVTVQIDHIRGHRVNRVFSKLYKVDNIEVTDNQMCT